MIIHTSHFNSEPAWSMSRVQGQPELHSKNSLKRKEKKIQEQKPHCGHVDKTSFLPNYTHLFVYLWLLFCCNSRIKIKYLLLLIITARGTQIM